MYASPCALWTLRAKLVIWSCFLMQKQTQIFFSKSGTKALVFTFVLIGIVSDHLLYANHFFKSFSTEHYQLYVPESAQVGSAVGKIKANDADIGLNADIRYAIVNGDGVFSISTDKETREGILLLKKVNYFLWMWLYYMCDTIFIKIFSLNDVSGLYMKTWI